MSEEYTDEELEQIRQRKLLEMQARMAEQARQEELRQQLEAQKVAILRQILTPEARARLTNLKMTRPEIAEQLELQLIQLAQAGRITRPVTDEELKEALSRLFVRKREIKIRRL
ncbi:MAG: DNA-binding protein [Candidatus Hadarchaeales archaeon]